MLKNKVDEWKAGRNDKLERIRGLGELNPITIVRNALMQCKDEAVYAGTDELDFIRDIELRESIWGDISAVRRALSNQEWKATTVLGGSVIEALLLWSISSNQETAIQDAIARLLDNEKLDSKPSSNKEKWNLLQYIHVCNELELITDQTKTQALLAKDFRNLIHPGKIARTGQVCDRGTAFTALAGVENVLRDLKNLQ